MARNLNHSYLNFFRGFLRNPKQNASVWPSSRRASRAMFDGIEWDELEYVVELGPGTGRFTEQMHAFLPLGCKVLVIELNPTFIPKLRERFGDRFEIIEGSADEFEALINERGWPRIDLIVSGLPFTLPEPVKTNLFNAILRQTKKNTRYRWFTYFPRLMEPHYQDFDFEKVRTVYWNIPPLSVYRVN
ncbi:MAG: hypothetical protein O2818_00925 [Bacteroidetes bacterium]|nr:hypothetical protein [Bacteroidota bacterium]MDA1335426.1 hypothetical protein [Bacteroidota bacterium]